MQDRRGLVLTIAVAIAGVALWITLRKPGVDTGPGISVAPGSEHHAAGDVASAPHLQGVGQQGLDPVPTAPTRDSSAEPGTIRGRVVDEQGDVVRELTIQLLTGRRYADCDEDGRFEFRRVSAGRHRLETLETVSSPVGDGVEVSLAPGQVLEDVEIVVPRPLPLSGIVVDDGGQPVSDLLLRFFVRGGHGVHGWMLRQPVRTNDRGRFLTRVWRKGGYRARGPKAVLTGIAEAGRDDTRLVYQEEGGSTLTVRILDRTGAPVPRATLMVRAGSSPYSFTGSERSVVNGLASVARQPFHRYMMLEVSNPLDAEGQPLPLAGTATGILEPEEAEVVLVLEAARRIAGHVVDEAGNPVECVGVYAWPSDWPPTARSRLWGASGPTGAFVLEGCPPGVLRVRTGSGSGREWLPGPAVDAEAGEENLVLTVRSSATLHVIVLGPDGKPVPGAAVRAVEYAGSARQSQGKTGADGRIALRGLPPSTRLDLRVSTDGASAVFPPAFRRDVSAPGELVVNLEQPVEIRGVVVDETGKPRGEVAVVGQSLNPAGPVENVKSEPVTGEFVLRRMRPGAARVWLGWGPDNRPPTSFVEVDAPAEGINLVIPTSVPVLGRLLVENPLEWSVVWALPNGSAMGTIEDDGRFRIAHARGPVGSILACPMRALVPGMVPAEADERISILEDVRPEDGPFVLVPESGARITGTVRGCPPVESRPINLRVWAKRGDVTLGGIVDEEGRFEIRRVAPGVWDIELWDQGVLDRAPHIQAGATEVSLEFPH